jgi:hypothetical protein
MKEARAPFPQLGNNLWIEAPPVEAKVLARFTGPGPASPQGALRKEGTLGAAERPPRRGGGQEAALQAERPAQAGRKAEVSSKKARKRPEVLASPAGAPRARDRRCLSDTDRDNGQSSTRPSQVVVMPGRLSGESRSGPEPWKLGRRGDRKDGHAAGDDVR